MSSWARIRIRSISSLPDREHQGHDEHEQREQQDRVDRDLSPLARARSRSSVGHLAAGDELRVERKGPGPQERHAGLAGRGQANPDRLAPGRRRRRSP